MKNVNASNFDFFVATAVDHFGHGKVVRLDLGEKLFEVVPKVYEVGQTNDNIGREIATLDLITSQVSRILQAEIDGQPVTKAKNILFAIQDSYAGRFFEIKKWAAKGLDNEATLQAIFENKTWMTDAHKAAVKGLVDTYFACEEMKFNLNAIKISELFYCDIKADDGMIAAGDKINIRGSKIEGHEECEMAFPLKPGEYEVKDIASYRDKKAGQTRLAVNRWTHIDEKNMPARWAMLVDAVRGAKDSLPKEERLKLVIA